MLALSDIVYSVALVGEGDPLDTEVSVNNQVSTENFCWHDLALLGIDDLLPRVGCVGHHEAKVEAELLNDLAMQTHDLADRKIVHDLLRVEYNLAPNRFAAQHGRWELNLLLLVLIQVPVIALPEYFAFVSVLHANTFDFELTLSDVIEVSHVHLGHLYFALFFPACCSITQHILK